MNAIRVDRDLLGFGKSCTPGPSADGDCDAATALVMVEAENADACQLGWTLIAWARCHDVVPPPDNNYVG